MVLRALLLVRLMLFKTRLDSTRLDYWNSDVDDHHGPYTPLAKDVVSSQLGKYKYCIYSTVLPRMLVDL